MSVNLNPSPPALSNEVTLAASIGMGVLFGIVAAASPPSFADIGAGLAFGTAMTISNYVNMRRLLNFCFGQENSLKGAIITVAAITTPVFLPAMLAGFIRGSIIFIALTLFKAIENVILQQSRQDGVQAQAVVNPVEDVNARANSYLREALNLIAQDNYAEAIEAAQAGLNAQPTDENIRRRLQRALTSAFQAHSRENKHAVAAED